MTGRDLAVWLYGSHSRGDTRSDSDVDLLAIGDLEQGFAEEVLFRSPKEKISVSHYSWSEIAAMSGYGSLFLQHVRGEGRPLFEGERVEHRLLKLLSDMGPYRLASRDVGAFRRVAQDVSEALTHQDVSIAYELSVLGTLIRHASILGCFLLGSPCFSR